MTQQFTALLVKELRIERRNPELLFTMALLSAAVVLTFTFASRSPSPRLAAPSLWIALTLCTVLATNRLYQREHETGTLDALLSGPVSPTALYLAKTSALFLYLLVVAALTSVLCAWLFDADFGRKPALLSAVVLAGSAGLSVVGSLLAALGGRRSGDLVLALTLMPLTIPVIIAAAKATEALVRPSFDDTPAFFWLLFLLSFDLLFGVLSLWCFEPLMRRDG